MLHAYVSLITLGAGLMAMGCVAPALILAAVGGIIVFRHELKSVWRGHTTEVAQRGG